MDPLFFTAQAAKAAAAASQAILAISHSIVIEDDDDHKVKRAKSVLMQRCRWDRFVILNQQDRPMFRRHLRMTYDSFLSLLEMIRPFLPAPDEKMGALRGGIIIPELQLYATIRYLVGASYTTDICFFCKISAPSFYRIL